MKVGPNIVRIAALIGDSARAEVLSALMGGRALTATELAGTAGVTKQTISAHLAKLLEAGLIACAQQGRHRYFRLADHHVASLLESLMGVAARTGALRVHAGPREPALRKARICYDHLAGELGVWAFETMLAQGIFLHDEALKVSDLGKLWFADIGIDAAIFGKQRRMLCRPCLDWSERRQHLGGALGAAFLQRCYALHWARQAKDSRVITFTVQGEHDFRALFRPNG